MQINHISFLASDDLIREKREDEMGYNRLNVIRRREKNTPNAIFKIENKQQGVFIVVIAVGLKIDRIMWYKNWAIQN